MADYKLEIDQGAMAEVKLTIAKLGGAGPIVISRATNDTLNSVKTKSVQGITGKTTLKATYVRQTFLIKKASIKDLSALVKTAGPPVPLIKYSVNKVAKGVSVKVLKASGKRALIRHAFKATMKSGHEGVYWREDWGGARKPVKKGFVYGHLKDTKYALPIHELYGPRVPDILDDPEIMGPVMKEANTRLAARLEHHTNRAIEAAK